MGSSSSRAVLRVVLLAGRVVLPVVRAVQAAARRVVAAVEARPRASS
jgi:hypothetical protein